MARFLTLKDQLDSEIASAEQRRKSYVGNDWWQCTEADAMVFAIDATRWPRMMMTHSCYEALKKIANDNNWDETLLSEVRQKHPDWFARSDGKPISDHAEFVEFGKVFSGLSKREAWAMYWKHEWWLIRAGLIMNE